MQNSVNAASQIPSWLPIVASLIGGGAMGALITALITHQRNKRQPIGYRVETIEIFKKNPELPSLQAHLMMFQETSQEMKDANVTPGMLVDNLSVARIWLINNGNQDIERFDFGITLDESNKAIDIKWENLDRHHIVEVLTPVSLSKPATEIDFTLQPFNRGDGYRLKVYFTYEGAIGTIRLSSPHPTNFSELPNRTGILDLLRDPSFALKFIFLGAISAMTLIIIVKQILKVFFQ